MTDQISSLDETLAVLQADREARKFDGERFEAAVLQHAVEIPSWEIAKCWRYLEWPDRTTVGVPLPPQDAGIDLVAVKHGGSHIAIQCKARSGGGSVTTKQIQQFAGAAPASVFAERWMVAEAHRSAATEDAAAVAAVTFVDFEAALADALEDAREQAATEPDPRTAMQQEAVAACVQALRAGLPEHRDRWLGSNPGDWMPRDAARATLVLPCGTGKTRVSMRIMSELSGPGDLGVVLVPSIALIAQVRREYLSHIGRPVRTLAVCSDVTAGHVDIERDPDLAADPTRDTGQVRAADVGCQVAQSAEAVADWLRAGADSTDLRIIFSTYQSAHHTADALLAEHQFAQVLILDEAHRTAQVRPVKSRRQAERLRVFTLCHDQEAFPARYRLYQTATPRVFDASNVKVARLDRTKWIVASMSDASIFGPVAYRLPYKEAVEKRFLSDYRIIAIGVDERAWTAANRIVQGFEQSQESRGLTTREALSWLVYGVTLAGGAVGDDGRLRVSRSLAFLNKVQRSDQMVKWLTSDEGRSEIERYFAEGGFGGAGRRYDVEHLDAGHPVRERRRALRDLAGADGENPRGIANVGIFGEGTDSPSLDAVALLAPRRSPTDVIQIVGRCMRRAPGKEHGYVIVPVPLPRGIDAETSLSMDTLGDEWKVLGEVLRALRAHDGRIEDEISWLLQIYVPPEDEQPVRQAVVVSDGPVTRVGVWTGPRGHAESAVNQAEVPAWREATDPGAAPVTEYLTPDKGFQWRDRPMSPDTPARFTDGPPGGDERILEESPAVLVLQRRRGGVTCTVQAAALSMERHGGVDVEKTVERAREVAEHFDPLPRRPRRRVPRRASDTERPTGLSPTQRLLEQIRQDGVGHDLRIEVMEKSGLRGNEVRDFNLLMEPVRRASAHLSQEELEGRLRAVLGMEHLQDTDAHADACTVSVLLLMNAALLHARLEDAKGQAADLARVGRLHEVATGAEPVKVLREAWTAVLRYDYEPVFRPALDVLEALAAADAQGGVNQAVRAVAAWAHENVEVYVSMGMEYAGELFSRVLGNQASDGAFFTRQSAARLLAELALDATGETAWAERRTWRRLRMADLACGSGTLLNAYLEAVKDRILKAGGDERSAAEFHKYAVERLVTGLDINPVSLQMAAGRMTLGNLSVEYRKMALRAMPYGSVDGKAVRLGTLELLTDEDVVGSPPANTIDSGKQGQGALFESSAVDPEIVQDVEERRIVMMNPPFTANDKKGRKFTPEVVKALQRRELQIRDRLAASDSEAAGVIDANSISTMFTPLAEKVLAKDDGVLAKIMPVTACTGSSGLSERRFLASRFHIDMIVCSHDPREPNLSTHTAINECLLIATRDGRASRASTLFVNLRRFPKTVEAVQDVVAAIQSRRIDEVGSVCEWPEDLVRVGDWSPVQWFDPKLAEAALQIRAASGLCQLNALYDMGPAGQRIRDAFEHVTDGSSTGEDVDVFDSVSSELRVSLAGDPDAVWRPRSGKESMVRSYLARMGWVLLTNRARVNNARLVGVCAAAKSFGSGFMPVVTETLAQAKALCVVWNSTPVLLQLLNMRTKMLMYMSWSVAQLGSVRVPSSLGDTAEAQAALVAVYDRLCHARLQSWAHADTDPVRHEIDDGVAEAYGISAGVLADWRERLANEPTIANRSPL